MIVVEFNFKTFEKVSRKYVFLFEPIYELNPIKNKKIMEKFKYAKNLKYNNNSL